MIKCHWTKLLWLRLTSVYLNSCALQVHGSFHYVLQLQSESDIILGHREVWPIYVSKVCHQDESFCSFTVRWLQAKLFSQSQVHSDIREVITSWTKKPMDMCVIRYWDLPRPFLGVLLEASMYVLFLPFLTTGKIMQLLLCKKGKGCNLWSI